MHTARETVTAAATVSVTVIAMAIAQVTASIKMPVSAIAMDWETMLTVPAIAETFRTATDAAVCKIPA